MGGHYGDTDCGEPIDINQEMEDGYADPIDDDDFDDEDFGDEND